VSRRLSQIEEVAALPPELQREVLAGLDLGALRWSWDWTARPDDQLKVTDSTAHTTLYMAGRGAGKTLTGAQWVRRRVNQANGRHLRFGLVGRTAADVRDVIVKGESGLMSVFPPSEAPRYLPSARTVEFHNGCTALCFTAEEPDQLRGPQFDYAWADELAAWNLRPNDSGLNAWDQLNLATRLGTSPQVLATTTPKRLALLRKLVKTAAEAPSRVLLVAGRTFDNVHLADAYLETITGLYGGTRLAAQELEAQLMADAEGALWTEAQLEALRLYENPGKLPLRAIGVDPSVSVTSGDECGIVLMGATAEPNPFKRTGYVLADLSLQGTPAQWAKVVVDTAKAHDAVVVVETNQGGDLVRQTLHNIDPTVRVKGVHAKDSKQIRAEPVAMMYDKGRVRHVGRFAELESQQTDWVPGDSWSPDRLDALVHVASALLSPVNRKSVPGRSTSVALARRVSLA